MLGLGLHINIAREKMTGSGTGKARPSEARCDLCLLLQTSTDNLTRPVIQISNVMDGSLEPAIDWVTAGWDAPSKAMLHVERTHSFLRSGIDRLPGSNWWEGAELSQPL